MDIKEIRSFIKALEYDLETIQYLEDFGRLKETLPILCRILIRIESSQENLKNSTYDFKDVFADAFWQKSFEGDLKLSDLCSKILDVAQKKAGVLDQEIKEEQYESFMWQVRSWVYQNIHLIRRRMNPLRQIKITPWKIVILAGVVSVNVVLIFLYFRDYNSYGLSGEFYEGRNFEKKIASGISKVIDFNSFSELSSKYRQSANISARWQGYLLAPVQGKYTFSMIIDDGARLFIDDKIIIDEWHRHRIRTYENILFLTQGIHKINIEYCNFGGPLTLELSWTPPMGKEEIIPARYLKITK